ncbi:hypothetical protein LOAG_15655, partial [Loa loa]
LTEEVAGRLCQTLFHEFYPNRQGNYSLQYAFHLFCHHLLRSTGQHSNYKGANGKTESFDLSVNGEQMGNLWLLAEVAAKSAESRSSNWKTDRVKLNKPRREY